MTAPIGPSGTDPIVLTGADLTVADVEAVARHGTRAVLDDAIVDELLLQPGIELGIDVVSRRVKLPDGRHFEFPLDAFAQGCLLDGIDQLGYLLKQVPAIERFEVQHAR